MEDVATDVAPLRLGAVVGRGWLKVEGGDLGGKLMERHVKLRRVANSKCMNFIIHKSISRLNLKKDPQLAG